MIYFLSGNVKYKEIPQLVLDVGGVGYILEITLPHFSSLPELGCAHSLWVFTKVREDSITLYGFLNREERLTFELLININGVGPKVALAILSVLSIEQLKDLAIESNYEPLQKVPGVGKKTAEKILLELKSKVDKLPSSSELKVHKKNNSSHKDLFSQQMKSEELTKQKSFKDLRSALNNLGFKDKELSSILLKMDEEYKGESFSELLRKSLQIIGQNDSKNHSDQSSVKSNNYDLDEIF